MWVQRDDLRPNVPHAQLTVFGQVSNIVAVPQSISRPTTYTATVAGFSRFSRDLCAYEVLWELHTNVDIEYDDDEIHLFFVTISGLKGLCSHYIEYNKGSVL